MSENRFLRLIEVLDKHEVRFIVVGGVAAVMQRVPINTEDFDFVYDRANDNIPRVLAALEELEAVYRDDPRNLRPNESHLRGPGNQLLISGQLKFDVLGALDPGGTYQDLLPHSELLQVGEHAVRVLTLEKLIELKRQLPRPKDKFMLVHLEATLRERRKTRGV